MQRAAPLIGADIIAKCTPLMVKLSKRAADLFREDSFDWFQELALDLLKYAHTYDPARGAPTTWVVLRYRRLLSLRKHLATAPKHAGQYDVRDATDRVYDRADHRVEDPAEVAERREVAELVEAAMVGLNKRDREVLKMRMAGLSLAAVSASVGVGKERVRQIERRAREKLKVRLGKVVA